MSPSDVPGFFYAEAAVRHILTVQKEQGIEGALAEIGVHHGKSFATMLDASASGVPVVAIDVFEDQHLNYDRSGNTTQDIFLSNLRNVFTASRLQQIVLHKGDSMELKLSELLRLTRHLKVALLSVDGCHTYRCTMSDLDLALSVLHDKGVIMVDDYANIGWPGVAIATGAFLQKHQTEIVAVAVGKNKLFICRRSSALLYSSIFQSFCRKHQCKVKGGTASSDQEMYILGPKQEMLPKFNENGRGKSRQAAT